MKLGLRRAQAISVVDVAVVVSRDQAGLVMSAAITLGSVAATIIRVPDAETWLIGKRLTDETIKQAGRIAAETATPIDDIRGSAAYRSEMVKVLVVRALRQLAADDIASALPEQPPMLWGKDGAVVRRGLPTQVVHHPDSPIRSIVNGKRVSIDSGQRKSLLHWLRDDVKLPGAKEGCAEASVALAPYFLTMWR